MPGSEPRDAHHTTPRRVREAETLRPTLVPATEPDPSGTRPRDGNSDGRGWSVIDSLAGEVSGAGTGGRTALLWGALTLAALASAVSPGGTPVGRLVSAVAIKLALTCHGSRKGQMDEDASAAASRASGQAHPRCRGGRQSRAAGGSASTEQLRACEDDRSADWAPAMTDPAERRRCARRQRGRFSTAVTAARKEGPAGVGHRGPGR
jgi:hypothetical protein